MGTFVIAGGNSGVGLQAAHELLAAGHEVILLGRDQSKGEAALISFGSARDRATFLSVDLSTHNGVRDAARRVGELTDEIDGLMHSAAVFATKDIRTADGLTLFFALSYLSRFHLTELLMPRLLKSQHPRVVMLTAALKKTPKIDPSLFPNFQPFKFFRAVMPINGACLYYADYLTKTHPGLFAACTTPGFVRTDIFKQAPWFLRAYVAVAGPLLANSLESAAHNPVQVLLRGNGSSAFMWPKAGNYDRKFAITVDPAVQKAIIESSREVTGL